MWQRLWCRPCSHQSDTLTSTRYRVRITFAVHTAHFWSEKPQWKTIMYQPSKIITIWLFQIKILAVHKMVELRTLSWRIWSRTFWWILWNLPECRWNSTFYANNSVEVRNSIRLRFFKTKRNDEILWAIASFVMKSSEVCSVRKTKRLHRVTSAVVCVWAKFVTHVTSSFGPVSRKGYSVTLGTQFEIMMVMRVQLCGHLENIFDQFVYTSWSRRPPLTNE